MIQGGWSCIQLWYYRKASRCKKCPLKSCGSSGSSRLRKCRPRKCQCFFLSIDVWRLTDEGRRWRTSGSLLVRSGYLSVVLEEEASIFQILVIGDSHEKTGVSNTVKTISRRMRPISSSVSAEETPSQSRMLLDWSPLMVLHPASCRHQRVQMRRLNPSMRFGAISKP